MKKILCFGDITDKYKKAIENAMRECPNIIGWEMAGESDELPETDDTEYIFLKCDIHSDDFLRHVIAINKKLMNGERFYLTHCAVFVERAHTKPPFILTDAACVPFPDENQLTHIVENAVSLFGRVMDKTRAPFVSLISAGGDTNTKLSPLLNSWYGAHVNEFPAGTLRVEQLDVALDAGIRAEKHLTGKIADIIVVDNINTGNAIFKSLSVVAGTWEPLCFLMGAKNMVILNSRGATMETLTHNIIMACRD